jgi:hypothetical protein
VSAPWERAARTVGGPAVVDGLAALPASELTALLLEVSARRLGRTTPAEVLRRYDADPFVAPSTVDPRLSGALDAHWFGCAAAFTPLELSPLAPSGAVSALALVHPNNVLATLRSAEVAADPTNVLALECARRRASAEVVRLCASHRVVRAQRVKDPGHTQHFRLFTMVTAGRDPGGRTFQSDALTEQLGVWLAALRSLPEGLEAEAVALVLAWDDAHAAVAERVAAGLPIPVRRDPDRLTRSRYYQGLAYKLEVRLGGGPVVPLGDGGFVDWTAKLRQDRRERLLLGAVGSELLCKLGRPPAPR